MKIQELLDTFKNDDLTPEQIEQAANASRMENLEVPVNLSIESTLREVEKLTERLYDLHNNEKRNPIILNKIVSLLELKIKVLGLVNVKPEAQDIIDSEINSYKRRVLELVEEHLGNHIMEVVTAKLAKEGL